MIHSLLKCFVAIISSQESHLHRRLPQNVVSLASKAFRDEKVDLKCTNGNVTEKNALHTSCNVKDITPFFSPKLFFIIPHKWLVFNNNAFHGFYLKKWLWLIAIDMKAKECRKTPLDNLRENLLRNFTKIPIFALTLTKMLTVVTQNIVFPLPHCNVVCGNTRNACLSC